jgi:membrane protease YdiL (CAAX protease family)
MVDDRAILEDPRSSHDTPGKEAAMTNKGAGPSMALASSATVPALGNAAKVASPSSEVHPAPLVLYAGGFIPVMLRANVGEAVLNIGPVVLAGIAWLAIRLLGHSSHIASWTANTLPVRQNVRGSSMTSPAQARTADSPHPSVRPLSSTGAERWGIPVQLGERRVLHSGRWLWLRALGWLVLLFFLTAAAFGLPLQGAVDLLRPGNAALQLVGLLVAAAAALSCYGLAVRLGEGRGASELALRPALPGLAIGAAIGLLMMSILMSVLVVTGLYDITLVGATPAWTGVGLAVQAAVTEELWMRALLLRLLWRAFGPVPAFIVAALVFGALHLANPGATPLAGATVVMAGLMFCALYALTGRLWVPIGLHLAWNFTQGYLFGATVSGNTLGGSVAVSTAHPAAAAWLTGGSFGPEASVFALLLISSATVGALALARKRWAGTPRRQRRRSRAAAAVTSLHPEAGDSAPRSLHQQPSLHHPPTHPTHPTKE